MYKVKSITEQEEKRILKSHPFLPGTHVRLLTITHTKGEGWISITPDHLLNATGIVLEVHREVINAVKVHLFESGDERFWHWKDFEIIEIKQEPQIFQFDPVHLNITTCTR